MRECIIYAYMYVRGHVSENMRVYVDNEYMHVYMCICMLEGKHHGGQDARENMRVYVDNVYMNCVYLYPRPCLSVYMYYVCILLFFHLHMHSPSVKSFADANKALVAAN